MRMEREQQEHCENMQLLLRHSQAHEFASSSLIWGVASLAFACVWQRNRRCGHQLVDRSTAQLSVLRKGEPLAQPDHGAYLKSSKSGLDQVCV